MIKMDDRIFYCFPFFLAAFLIFIAALYTFRRVNARGGWYLALVCLSATVWAAAEGFLYLGLDIKTNIFITKFQYFGVTPLPPLALLFGLTVFDCEFWNTRRLRSIFFIIATVIILLIWTNPLHKLIFPVFYTIDTGSFPMLGVKHGALWWVILFYHYSLIACLSMILFRQMITSTSYLRSQAGLAMAAVSLVWISNVIYVSGHSPIPHMDVSPIAFVIVAGSMAWGFFRFRLLDILPVARAEIFRELEDAILVIDHKDRLIDMNRTAESLFRTHLDKIIGQDVFSVFNHFPQLKSNAREVKTTEISLIKEGQKHVYDLCTSTIKNSEGTKAGKVISLRDITERKRMEKSLRESEEKLRDIIEHSTNLFYAHDVNGRLIYLSPQSREFLQCEPDDQVHRLKDFVTKNPINKKGLALSAKAVKTGQRQSCYEAELVGRKGRKIWVEVNEAPVVKNGESVAIVGSLTDITKRKQAEEELKKSHQTFLTVLDGIDATIHVSDMDSYEILFMNQRMIDHFNGDHTGGTCFDAFHGYDRPCDHCTNDKLLDAEGQPLGACTYEKNIPKIDKWFMIFDRAIRWIDGRIVRLQIATDITKVKRLEQERFETEIQLQQAQKMESVGRLAGGVAHDFNNMLGVIMGRTEMLMELIDTSPLVHANLKEIYNATCRSADLTRQLLAFARKQAILPKVLDLNHAVTGMHNMLKRLIGENIDLIWNPKEDIWPIKIDPTQLDQILANLCVNARDAIEGTGKISIKTENVVIDGSSHCQHEVLHPGEYVLLSVTDTGIGMEKEILEKLFEPFFTTKDVGEGTGLGLSTVYGIIKQNNGYINTDSTPGKGTTFKIYFPRETEPVEPLENSPEMIFKKGSETVLFVEDELPFLRLGQTLLERFGYKILPAQCPSEAIAIAENEQGDIDLLVTDVVMPEMNGKALRKRIEKIKPGIKSLFISGYTPDVIVNQGIFENDIDFLPKPFTVNALITKVQEILHPKEESTS